MIKSKVKNSYQVIGWYKRLRAELIGDPAYISDGCYFNTLSSADAYGRKMMSQHEVREVQVEISEFNLLTEGK